MAPSISGSFAAIRSTVTGFAHRADPSRQPEPSNIGPDVVERTTQTEENLPTEFFCTITSSVMLDPVSTPMGKIYERIAIETWLHGHSTCPLTNLPLNAGDLKPATELHAQIQANPIAKKLADDDATSRAALAAQLPHPQPPPQVIGAPERRFHQMAYEEAGFHTNRARAQRNQNIAQRLATGIANCGDVTCSGCCIGTLYGMLGVTVFAVATAPTWGGALMGIVAASASDDVSNATLVKDVSIGLGVGGALNLALASCIICCCCRRR